MGLLKRARNITTTAKFSGKVNVSIVYPDPVSPPQMLETDIVPGDVILDGVVNWKDLFLILKAMGSRPGDPRRNPNCDLNHNNKIDIGDLLTALKNYGKTSQWTNITTYVDTVNHIIYGRTDHFSLIYTSAIHLNRCKRTKENSTRSPQFLLFEFLKGQILISIK